LTIVIDIKTIFFGAKTIVTAFGAMFLRSKRLSVELKLNKSSFRIGDDLEISIRNISGDKMIMPCETNSKDVIGSYKTSPPPGYQEILLRIYDEYDEEKTSLTEVLLVGSNLPASVRNVMLLIMFRLYFIM
jgi:hypothetical protein